MRYAASFSPASPSSVIFTPAPRGGFSLTWVRIDCGADAGSMSTPRSASDTVSNGFFFAAMMPLKFGNRASGSASVIEMTAGSGALT